jgi:hypothetical protein
VTTSDTAKRPPGFKTRNASTGHQVLVGREIDDAIGNDHVNGIVRQRDVLDFALEELDILYSDFALVLICRPASHPSIEAMGFACRSDPPGGEQNIDAAARAQIKNSLTGLQFGQGGGIAAPQRRQQGFLGNLVRL